MSIDFGPERWHRVVQDYATWWAGELARPLIHIELTGADPRRARKTKSTGPNSTGGYATRES